MRGTRILWWGVRCLSWVSLVLVCSGSASRQKCLDGKRIRMGDGCWHVYLDVGSNIGVQVRKLFEPHLYPGAPVLYVYESRFRINRWKPLPRTVPYPHSRHNNLTSHICAFGWEPNPTHANWLYTLETVYNRQGWRIKFFKETAVGVSDGEKSTFYLSQGNMGIASAVFPTFEHRSEGGTQKAEIVSFDLSRFILEELVYRELPSGDEKEWGTPTVMMKMDIEGSEYELLPHMLFDGSLCHIDLAFIEWHDDLLHDVRVANPEKKIADGIAFKEFAQLLNKTQLFDRQCKLQLVPLDDETFQFDGKLLPYKAES